MANDRGSIAFFATYRPAEPLDIFSNYKGDELQLTDGLSSNYNGYMIPRAALKKIMRRPILAREVNENDVESGMIFVSERENNLETLHISLRFKNSPEIKVYSFSDVYGMLNIVRMEDSGRIAGDYLVYISTMDDSKDRRQPWTVLYKTNLETAQTERLTPSWHADLSPAVSPSGDMVAVATFQRRGGWHGEIEDLRTDIYVMNLVKPFKRRLVVANGGWPTWGSKEIIFFHRKVGKNWKVFQANISNGLEPVSVTPKGIVDAMTPAAISETKVVVAAISPTSKYRHIKIIDTGKDGQLTEITLKKTPTEDHFNPFVIDGAERIGYHRCNLDKLKGTKNEGDNPKQFYKLKCPDEDIGLYRVSGVFPTFSSDCTKLAFVDNEFTTVWVVERGGKARIVYQERDGVHVFSPVWNQKEDTLYICKGPSFEADQEVAIYAIFNASKIKGENVKPTLLTKAGSNNAFPSSSPDGKRLVFRTRREESGKKIYKKLYIMEDAKRGEYNGGKAKRLTSGPGTDTHCQWSPRGEWIAFSSTRDKPKGAPKSDNDLDPGYFGVYLVHADKPEVVVRVIGSGPDISGHVNHPVFSPDGMCIAVTSDLAGVSVDPISLPFFVHSVRPYGDIFVVHVDWEAIQNNKDVKFIRVTHSRYENSTPSWTIISSDQFEENWKENLLVKPRLCPMC
ncbi:uncharacterized protein LOC126655091 [Mercurialis annua]|uniref:uncharacterized protein LOC126655091 n=1 Tax=Mercurialis annua TaxID=3986 RepID=UPI00215DE41F|nr:uncharacterized protein LOC126655091 [Mercurialis annua]